MKEEERPKSWWQTLAGLMTGAAALITAIAGLIVAIHQTREREPKNEAVGAAGPAISMGGIESLNAAPSTPDRRVSRTSTASGSVTSGSATPAASQNVSLDNPTVITRQPYAVTLPERREYTLRGGGLSHWYRLIAAKVTPETPESDALIIRVSSMSREDTYPVEFSSFQFQLLANDKTLRPERTFIDRVPPREPREKDLSFIIPTGITKAVLRIQVADASAEIPLDLALPD